MAKEDMLRAVGQVLNPTLSVQQERREPNLMRAIPHPLSGSGKPKEKPKVDQPEQNNG